MRLKAFTSGIFGNNPVMKQVLGLCPALAVTTSAINGIAWGGLLLQPFLSVLI